MNSPIETAPAHADDDFRRDLEELWDGDTNPATVWRKWAPRIRTEPMPPGTKPADQNHAPSP